MPPPDVSWVERRDNYPLWRRRQMALTERMALAAAAATVPYEVYYALTNLSYFRPVFLANLIFIALCAAAVVLNRRGRFDMALNLVVAVLYVHLFVLTSLLSTGPGIHLYYFSLGGSLGMFFIAGRESLAFGLTLLATALLITCHLAFPPGSTRIAIDHTVEQVMYATNAAAAVLLSGGFSYLFRLDIDRAERDLTRSNQQLERLSGVDALTGLANRRALDAYLTREWSRLSRQPAAVALLLCDVDHFKEYNDHYGHLAGDICLQRVAGALATVVHRSTDLLARYGGEEFLITLIGTDPAHVQTTAERLQSAVQELRLAHERSTASPVVTISVGIVIAPLDELPEPDDLIARADRALYAAKRAGRNRAVYHDELEEA